MREFTTQGKKVVSPLENPVAVTFSLDGEELTAYPPSAGQLAYLVASQADSRDVSEQMAAMIDFVDGILDENGRDMFRTRLLDRDDPFDIDDVERILEALMEEWSTRPTMPSSASSSSPASGGRRSTAKPRSKV